jgi:hypothetical protein
VLEEAVQLAGSLDKGKIREQLRNMTILSLLGRFRFDETTKRLGEKTHGMQWQDGTRRLVLPGRHAKQSLRYSHILVGALAESTLAQTARLRVRAKIVSVFDVEGEPKPKARWTFAVR